MRIVTEIATLKADDKIKVRRRIFIFKTFSYVYYIMLVKFIFHCFLLILLVSILFSASNRFVCYIVEGYLEVEEKQIEYSLSR